MIHGETVTTARYQLSKVLTVRRGSTTTMGMKSIQEYFPSLIFQKRILRANSPLIRDLLAECQTFSEQDRRGQAWSKKNYPGGYTSYASLPPLDQLSPTFAELKTLIDLHVAEYISALEMDIKPKDLFLSSMWINRMPAQVVHTGHIHPLSVISGTFYVQTPPGASALKFEDPRLTSFMGSPPRKAKAALKNQRFVNLNPQAGEVILFESWMRHEVPPNQSKAERVSVSFNYDWK